MAPFPMEVLVGLIMLAVAVAIAVGYRRYLAAGSERRMRAMLEAVGVDRDLIASRDAATIMAEVRGRCRQCQSESVCERWLEGEEVGKNEFCPNRQVFEILKQFAGATS